MFHNCRDWLEKQPSLSIVLKVKTEKTTLFCRKRKCSGVSCKFQTAKDRIKSPRMTGRNRDYFLLSRLRHAWNTCGLVDKKKHPCQDQHLFTEGHSYYLFPLSRISYFVNHGIRISHKHVTEISIRLNTLSTVGVFSRPAQLVRLVPRTCILVFRKDDFLYSAALFKTIPTALEYIKTALTMLLRNLLISQKR
ncbi:hypothetical protein TNCV_520851 [Trichonephila clavipes]|nr:hypothetical protein TNCV_520851 [Trichonephila clavipes]